MNEVAVRTPMQYLDKAVGALRDVGVMPAKIEPVPINALLQEISDLHPEKIAAISRTLSQASVFNEVVRNEISGMEIGERYKAITEGFNSIRDDAKRMVDQLADSKLDVMERATDQTGFFREHPRYQGRAYFIVVDAIDPRGNPVKLPVRNDETNETETVSRFAVRVPAQTFDAVRNDKSRNGIVQNSRLGQKRRGLLEPEFLMPVLEGRLTRW